MTSIVKIAVDGVDGDTAASGARGSNDGYCDAALTRTGRSIDGETGRDAAPAIPGSPAGAVEIHLSESLERQGFIYAGVTRVQSVQRPPARVEVPPGRNLLLTAVGGHGEAGGRGGGGQPGRDGVPGAPATRETDATAGTNAGNGGNAGSGSNGGDGGDGGAINVVVREQDTHLLMALEWDVDGGKGGEAGWHGEPGPPGQGGRGGLGYTWPEIVGYKYHCTRDCGKLYSETGSSQSLTSYGSILKSHSSALLARNRAQAVQGGNLTAMIARVAEARGARRQESVDPGVCRCCPGGSGNCIGCRVTPVRSTFSRAPGLDGRDGRPGEAITEPLFAGSDGLPGTCSIEVQGLDGAVRAFERPYKLELVDFDVEDENQDGVFEPGESILIKRIRVRNIGGMPSPVRRIRLWVASSRWLIPDHSQAHFIPQSIPPGESITINGGIRALIKQPDRSMINAAAFSRKTNVGLIAVMPWLDRELPDFKFTQEIQVEYPCQLRGLDCLNTLAQGSRSQVTWEVGSSPVVAVTGTNSKLKRHSKVYNKSRSHLGIRSDNARTVHVQVEFPRDSGSLLDASDNPTGLRTHNIPFTRQRHGTKASQELQICDGASAEASKDLSIALLISSAQSEEFFENAPGQQMRLIQRLVLPIHISEHHVYDPRSELLLVTNSQADRRLTQTVRNFVQQELRLGLDCWNISLYGGFRRNGITSPTDTDDADEGNVLSLYAGKTILILGNKIDFNGGKRSVAELCSPQVFHNLVQERTNCLILQSSDDAAFRKLVQGSAICESHYANSADGGRSESTEFGGERDLLKSLVQQEALGVTDGPKSSKVPVNPRWYQSSRTNSRQQARRISDALEKRFPHSRFFVTFAPRHGHQDAPGGEKSDATDRRQKSGDVLVFSASNPQASVFAVKKPTNDSHGSLRTRRQHQLSFTEKYAIVASFSVDNRIRRLCFSHTSSVLSLPETIADDACEYSIANLIASEIFTYLGAGQLSDSKLVHRQLGGQTHTLPSHTPNATFLKLKVPTLSAVFLKAGTAPAATTSSDVAEEGDGDLERHPSLPARISSVLQYAFILCLPQRKRQIPGLFLPTAPFRLRRNVLRGIIKSEVDALLTSRGYDAAAVARFYREARGLHSIWSGSKRDTAAALVQRSAALTRTSEHVFMDGLPWAGAGAKPGPSEGALGAGFCRPKDWKRRCKERESTERSIRRDEKAFGNALRSKLIVRDDGRDTPIEAHHPEKVSAARMAEAP